MIRACKRGQQSGIMHETGRRFTHMGTLATPLPILFIVTEPATASRSVIHSVGAPARY